MSQTIFLVSWIFGLALLVAGFVFGEILDFGDGGVDLDLDGDTGGSIDVEGQTPSWVDLKVLCAALVGFGASGYVSEYLEMPDAVSWLIAAVFFFLMGAGSFYLVIKPMSKLQSNSMIGRESYVGRRGEVILPIPPGGKGQIIFVDVNQSKVVQVARTDEPEGLPRGASVVIYEVGDDLVVVTPYNP